MYALAPGRGWRCTPTKCHVVRDNFKDHISSQKCFDSCLARVFDVIASSLFLQDILRFLPLSVVALKCSSSFYFPGVIALCLEDFLLDKRATIMFCFAPVQYNTSLSSLQIDYKRFKWDKSAEKNVYPHLSLLCWEESIVGCIFQTHDVSVIGFTPALRCMVVIILTFFNFKISGSGAIWLPSSWAPISRLLAITSTHGKDYDLSHEIRMIQTCALPALLIELYVDISVTATC
jgi:hypothetical protein